MRLRRIVRLLALAFLRIAFFGGVALFAYRGAGDLIDPALAAYAPNVGVGPFTVSLWPVAAATSLGFLVWETAGRRPSVIGYFFAAPFIAAGVLWIYVRAAYDYRLGPPVDSMELVLLGALALGGAAFAAAARGPGFLRAAIGAQGRAS